MPTKEESLYWEQSSELLAESIKDYLDEEYPELEGDFRIKKFFEIVDLPVIEIINLLDSKVPNDWVSNQLQYLSYHKSHQEEGDYLPHLEEMQKSLIKKYEVDYNKYKNDLG